MNSTHTPRALIIALHRATILIATVIAGLAQATSGFNHFITRQGNALYEGDAVYRFVSANMPDALQIITNYQFDGDSIPTRYRLPNEYELRDCVRTAKQMGGQAIRTFVITCSEGQSPYHMFDVSQMPVAGNEDALLVIDKLLQICNEENIRVIIPFVAYKSSVRGDVTTYGEDFWQVGSEANRKFKNMVSQLVNRKNHYTGVSYRDDRAILGWHTGNELVIGDDPERREWLHDFAAYLKSQDPNHLLIDGRNRPSDIHNRYDDFLDDPNIDAVSYHTYVNLPEADTPSSTLRLINQQMNGKKPVIVTEIAMYTKPHALRSLLDEVVSGSAVGAQWWAIRFHNRDGGFYKHSDRNSEFEDLNWPGFERSPNSPTEIDRERELLNILDEYAWKINQQDRPPSEVPLPPRLLDIPDPGHISWQGSTGAVSYRLQRARTAKGPWSDVGSKLSEHLVSYAAQFCDRSAQAGNSYYYRIFARNKAGESTPSNVVGPVLAEHNWLVDELFDLSLVSPKSSNLRIEQAYAHSAYLEDIALAVREEAEKPAKLVYQLPHSIRFFTATVYNSETIPRLYSISKDGTRLEIQPQVGSYDNGKRRRITARIDSSSKQIVLELSPEADPGQAIGRVEIATEASN